MHRIGCWAESSESSESAKRLQRRFNDSADSDDSHDSGLSESASESDVESAQNHGESSTVTNVAEGIRVVDPAGKLITSLRSQRIICPPLVGSNLPSAVIAHHPKGQLRTPDAYDSRPDPQIYRAKEVLFSIQMRI